MPENKEIIEQMDASAKVAQGELAELITKYPEVVGAIGAWMKKHYLKAGYKRLGRQLITVAD